MKPESRLLRFLVLAASSLLAVSSAHADTTIDFESYTLGALTSSPNATTDRPFDGQDGWSRSTSANVGNIIATTTSGSYTGGQALTATTGTSAQTYIGAKAVGAFTSFRRRK
jgi:hypothetical protein